MSLTACPSGFEAMRRQQSHDLRLKKKEMAAWERAFGLHVEGPVFRVKDTQ